MNLYKISWNIEVGLKINMVFCNTVNHNKNGPRDRYRDTEHNIETENIT